MTGVRGSKKERRLIFLLQEMGDDLEEWWIGLNNKSVGARQYDIYYY